MIEVPRRRFLAGLGALVAAPAIVRVASIMPVKAPALRVFPLTATMRVDWKNRVWMDVRMIRDRNVLLTMNHYAGHTDATR